MATCPCWCLSQQYQSTEGVVLLICITYLLKCCNVCV